ncbi:MAG: hypothetical protein IPM16_14475 [Chloroflexi bacterium]|nr:hypothetical protein [Chloroflexota bacterium]
MNEIYDIVVAYRRGPRWAAATLTHQSLVHHNRRALIDHMNSGLGRPQTLAAVRACRVFVLVLGPGDLERCAQTDDELRVMITVAFSSNCVVVPVLVDQFTYERDKAHLVGLLQELPKLQVVRLEPYQPYPALERLNTLVEKYIPTADTEGDLWSLPAGDTSDALGQTRMDTGEIDGFCDNAEASILAMDWTHAAAMIRRALEGGRDMARPHRVMGDLFAVRGLLDKAADAYTQAINLDPFDLRSYERRMEMNLRRGRAHMAYDDAAAAALRAQGNTTQLAEHYASRFGSDKEHALKRILEAIARRKGETSEYR